MATYLEWNAAIIAYFTVGVPEGNGLYLSVDEDVLISIGAKMGTFGSNDDIVQDFERAVRTQVIRGSNVDLGPLMGSTPNGEPMGVAFIAAQVLAASRMGEEEGIDQINYFRRLNDILRIREAGRPQGMSPAQENEKRLWDAWDVWLQVQERGLLPTSETGSGPTTYIMLPISQSLLRKADRDKLAELFETLGRQSTRDKDVLFYQISRESRSCTRHLRELLNDPGLRYEALVEEIYETWQEWFIFGGSPPDRGKDHWRQPTSISLKLYRTEDPLEGVRYHFYPEIPHRMPAAEAVRAEVGDFWQELRPDRPGWYTPLPCSLTPQDLDAGRSFPVEGHPSIQSLALAPRDFWILVRDPEDPDSGVHASWGRPILGETFTLLFRDSILEDLELLRDEVLIEWQGDPKELTGYEGWLEVSECSAVSTFGWSGVFTKNAELLQALIPVGRLSIGLSGGLRLLNPLRWLCSHPPQISVVSPDPHFDVTIRDVRTGDTIFRSQSGELTAATTHAIAGWVDRPGDYQISARVGEYGWRRVLKLVHWDDLEPTPLIDPPTTDLTPPWKVSGAVLSNCQEPSGE